MAAPAPPAGVITLNIGGTLYTTTSATLTNPVYGDTFFTSLLSGRFASTRDRDGNLFVDRNGRLFEYVLDYLRTGKWRVPTKVKAAVREEAAFYGIPLPFALISDDLCDELLLKSQVRSASHAYASARTCIHTRFSPDFSAAL